MHKENLAINNLQLLICHKTLPNQKYYLQNGFTNIFNIYVFTGFGIK